jgi:hypothetical protein
VAAAAGVKIVKEKNNVQRGNCAPGGSSALAAVVVAKMTGCGGSSRKYQRRSGVAAIDASLW